eukprot:scaffold23424_cov121-Isochrysis_galbana.AAC.2
MASFSEPSGALAPPKSTSPSIFPVFLRPDTTSSRVVLPEPDGPISAVILPAWKRADISERSCRGFFFACGHGSGQGWGAGRAGVSPTL